MNKKLRRMECLWRLFCHRRADGNSLPAGSGSILFILPADHGVPIILYMVLAFLRNLRKYIWAARRNPWYYSLIQLSLPNRVSSARVLPV